jgi:hypothetical protein
MITNNSKLSISQIIEGHDKLLVSFGGIRQGLGVHVFEFFKSLENLDCDKIFIRDFNQAWYHKGIDKDQSSINETVLYLKEKCKGYKKVCFLGNSMGGYASILFGVLVEVDTILAFSPQTFIDRFNRLKYLDRRWKKQIQSIYSSNAKQPTFFDLKKVLKTKRNIKTKIFIHHSSKHRLDNAHAQRIRNLNNVKVFPHSQGGHAVVRWIKEKGELISIIEEAIN